MRDLSFSGEFRATLDLTNFTVPIVGSNNGQLTFRFGSSQASWEFIELLCRTFPPVSDTPEFSPEEFTPAPLPMTATVAVVTPPPTETATPSVSANDQATDDSPGSTPAEEAAAATAPPHSTRRPKRRTPEEIQNAATNGAPVKRGPGRPPKSGGTAVKRRPQATA